MEFKQYLKILKANIAIVVIFTIGGLMVSLFASTKVSIPYQQSQLVFLQTIDTDNVQTQSYSGYYAQEKARNFTDTAVSILASHDFILDAQIQHNLTLDAKKLAPQLIRITLSAPDSQNRTSEINSVVEALNTKLKSITGKNYLEATLVTQPTRIAFTGPDRKVIVLAGLLAGLIFALCTISAKTYFKL